MQDRKAFKCEGCGGILYFDPESNSLKCEYCGGGAGFKSEPVSGNIKEKYSAEFKYAAANDAKHIYECASCKTKMADVMDKTATRCVACGSRELVEIQAGGVHPAVVIPFSVSRSEAAKSFKAWIASRKFSPNNLKKMAKLQKLSGFYVPVYSFDLVADTKYSATGVDYYRDSEGERKSRSRRVSGNERMVYSDYLIPATHSVEVDVLDGLEGFNLSSSRKYASEFMLGFYGVGTDYDIHKAHAIMDDLVARDEKNRIERELRKRFDDVDFLKTQTTISEVYNAYYYAPVWANHYKYKNKDYHCYINGQTGKAYGKAPKSFWKIFALVLGIVAGAALLAWLLGPFK